MKLLSRRIEKPWGRDSLPASFGEADARRIGEIWFETADDRRLPLLAKYLLTSEQLSVQVHPGDDTAASLGASCGKSECWYVVDAAPGARVGLGFREELSLETIRQSALDGSIQELLAWQPVRKGDFIFVPAGTVHTIGAGLTIFELQQNCDVTFRLFDYGRARELQLEQALAAANPGPADPTYYVPADDSADRMLISVPQFAVARVSTEMGAKCLLDRDRWVVPLSGSVSVRTDAAGAGECLLAPRGEPLLLAEGATAIVAAVGTTDQSQG